MLNLIADQAWNPFAPFGVTSWEPFVANLIAFILMVVILRYLAFKPIQNVLEKGAGVLKKERKCVRKASGSWLP